MAVYPNRQQYSPHVIQPAPPLNVVAAPIGEQYRGSHYPPPPPVVSTQMTQYGLEAFRVHCSGLRLHAQIITLTPSTMRALTLLVRATQSNQG